VDAELFWSKVKRGGPDECWPWLAATNEKGYGVVGGKDGTTKANRVAWKLTNGPIPDGKCVLHRCDNPPCCNPGHLFTGTRGDNNRDMHAKGRGVVPPMAGWNRLTLAPEIVAQLGQMPDHALADLAGTNKTTIARNRRKLGIKSYADSTGTTGQFKRGHYPARWLKRKGGG
jgi:uncharacterized protein YjiS (DUF1127 family)